MMIGDRLQLQESQMASKAPKNPLEQTLAS